MHMKRFLCWALMLPLWLLVIAGCGSPSISGNILVNDRLPDDSLRNRLKVYVEYGEGQKVRSTGVKVEDDGWRFKIKVNLFWSLRLIIGWISRVAQI